MRLSETGRYTQGDMMTQAIPGATGGVAGLVGEVKRVVDLELRSRLPGVVVDVETDILARLRICRGCGAVFLAAKRGGRAKRCESCRLGAHHG